ncbi:hypothetical protein FHT08_000202 [Xanthomonas campestris]|uniref:hypothetical protein n=1 Tax=Xanthomonas sp. CFBP 8151 TaxID=3035310 RepID=UPI00141B9126|nr:hypothetical protein [Xanthomonas sp. CFBP 8151]NIJ75154.1 hypothetical protein [Xanthomonas sp. CFBP 8151]
MRGLFSSLLQRARPETPPQAPPAAGTAGAVAHAQPRIETGSTLHTLAGLDPVATAALADAFAAEVQHSIASCTLGQAGTTRAQAMEQIHSLKNTISLTGSGELLNACDQLRNDVDGDEPGSALAQRYTATATAAGLLVENYRRTLPNDDTAPHA